jgi:hypothetical protein
MSSRKDDREPSQDEAVMNSCKKSAFLIESLDPCTTVPGMNVDRRGPFG